MFKHEKSQYQNSIFQLNFTKYEKKSYDTKLFRGEAAKLAHPIESASLKRKYMTKNYEKIFI